MARGAAAVTANKLMPEASARASVRQGLGAWNELREIPCIAQLVQTLRQERNHAINCSFSRFTVAVDESDGEHAVGWLEVRCRRGARHFDSFKAVSQLGPTVVYPLDTERL